MAASRPPPSRRGSNGAPGCGAHVLAAASSRSGRRHDRATAPGSLGLRRARSLAEAAVVRGELERRTRHRAAERLERWLYRSAAAIVTVTEPFREQIASVGGEPRELTVIPNGTTEVWLDAGAREPDRAAASLAAGDSFGLWRQRRNGQGLEFAVEAAAMLGEGFGCSSSGQGRGSTLCGRGGRAAWSSRGVSLAHGASRGGGGAARLRRTAGPARGPAELEKFVPSKLSTTVR